MTDPATGIIQRERARVLERLTTILSGVHLPKVGKDHQAPPQRNSWYNTNQVSASNSTTLPATICATRQIHQRVKRSNTPMSKQPNPIRQGVWSTRSNRNEILDARMQVDNMHLHKEACTIEDEKMFCYALLADMNEGTDYSDLIRRFPFWTYSGMHYIFDPYIYSKNAILMQVMSNRTNASMVLVFKDIYQTSKTWGWQPKLYLLDNKCSKAVQNYICEENV